MRLYANEKTIDELEAEGWAFYYSEEKDEAYAIKDNVKLVGKEGQNVVQKVLSIVQKIKQLNNHKS